MRSASPVMSNVGIFMPCSDALSTYPDVQLEIWTELGLTDIVASGFDAIIGSKLWAASNMIKVRLTGPIEVAVVAAPMYFAGRRPPRTPEDLITARNPG